MNVYFLVEGKRTEPKIYPKWLNILVPNLVKIDDPFSLHDNQLNNRYYMFNGGGFPSILNHIENSIADINKIGRFNYFVICLDSEEDTVEGRINCIKEHIKKKNIILNEGTKLEIVVQNKCIETWLLGNNNVFKPNPSNPDYCCDYVRKYNVGDADPELMPSFNPSLNAAQYHAKYLSLMLSERHMSYSKTRVRHVTTPDYLQNLIDRHNNTGHLKSFKTFLDFCDKIKI